MSVRNAQQTINDTVTAWEGISAHPHRFGGTEFRIGKREIGHIHGDSMVDIPFPVKLRDEVVNSGRAAPHHLLPETGWVSFYIREPEDVQRAIELLRLSFEVAQRQKTPRVTEVHQRSGEERLPGVEQNERH